MGESKINNMNWLSYVQSIVGDDNQTAIGHKVGVSPASVSRWGSSAPKPENVAAFARAYNRPVLEAFVAAGFLTADEAKVRPAGKPRVSDLDSRELLAEVERRMGLTPAYDPDDPANYDLAAYPYFKTEHEKFEEQHGDRGEENQDTE